MAGIWTDQISKNLTIMEDLILEVFRFMNFISDLKVVKPWINQKFRVNFTVEANTNLSVTITTHIYRVPVHTVSSHYYTLKYIHRGSAKIAIQ